MRALIRPVQRLVLAVKFHVRLGYSWRLAWVKASQ
jgi:hypothetical protein